MSRSGEYCAGAKRCSSATLCEYCLRIIYRELGKRAEARARAWAIEVATEVPPASHPWPPKADPKMAPILTRIAREVAGLSTSTSRRSCDRDPVLVDLLADRVHGEASFAWRAIIDGRISAEEVQRAALARQRRLAQRRSRRR